jgi:hypothetical protein
MQTCISRFHDMLSPHVRATEIENRLMPDYLEYNRIIGQANATWMHKCLLDHVFRSE